MLYSVDAPHFCAGLEVTNGRVTSWCAPILGWARGKPWLEVRAYCLRKGWDVDDMTTHITRARSIAALDALVPEIRLLPEDERERLRIPWRSARELLQRIAAAPAIASCDASRSTFRRP